jgi:hypothetical protein
MYSFFSRFVLQEPAKGLHAALEFIDKPLECFTGFHFGWLNYKRTDCRTLWAMGWFLPVPVDSFSPIFRAPGED